MNKPSKRYQTLRMEEIYISNKKGPEIGQKD